jgi:hypothetical protein
VVGHTWAHGSKGNAATISSGTLALSRPKIRSRGKVSGPWLQLFSRQIAKLRTPAKATHAANGKRHHAAILSSR